MTYDKILNNMKNTFYEQCGENVDMMGDLGARFSAVASELLSLYCYGNFVLKQAFVQTASGKYLDYHATLRDMQRKSSDVASGELVFSITEVSDSDVEIPKGTICSVSESPYIQFETIDNAVIKAGELSVSVNAQAVESGSDYNVESGTINVMVNPPSGVSSVNNAEDFTGGCDDECDDSLRKRLLNSYSVPATGVSALSIAESIMKFDDVLDCVVANVANIHISVYLITKSGKADDELIEKIQESVMIAKLVDLPVSVYIAEPKKFNLNIDATVSKGMADTVENEIRKRVIDYTDALKIGETLSLVKLSYEVSKIDGVEYCEVSCNSGTSTSITCNKQSHLKLKNLTVNCYE
jgi:phage-related baseplate assembly protein